MNEKIKLEFSDAKYHVNKEKGTVVCVLTAGYSYDLFNYALANYGPDRTYFEAVGVAKCNPEDKFDEKLGKRLAESKAKRNAYKKYVNILNNILSGLTKATGLVEFNKSVMFDYIEREEEHYKELLK